MLNKEQIFEQNAQIAALKRLSEILDHVSTRVVLVKKTPTNERYTAEYGEDKAYINITDLNTTINIVRAGKKIFHQIVSQTNDVEVKSALSALKDQLALQSKMGPLMSKPGIIGVHTETAKIKFKTLKAQHQTLRVDSANVNLH